MTSDGKPIHRQESGVDINEDKVKNSSISQRKLFRVKRWKDNAFKNKNKLQKDKIRSEGLSNVEDHDYVILTDTENYINENIDVLEGYHHLYDH